MFGTKSDGTPVQARMNGDGAEDFACYWSPVRSHEQLDNAGVKDIHDTIVRVRKTEVRGASTITNQCARSIFLWQGRSWIRKGLESYYTIWMELLLPKRRILELYANVIETGRGIYGGFRRG